MTRAGYTKAPCHGCGSTFGRPKDGLCQDCQAALSEAQKMAKERKAAAERGTGVVRAREVAYALPYLMHEPREKDETKTIRGALLVLSNAVSTPVLGYPGSEVKDLWPGQRESSWATYRHMDPLLAKKFADLFTAIAKGMDHAYSEGAENGRNLLMGLASGKITNDEFNTTAARQGKRTE